MCTNKYRDVSMHINICIKNKYKSESTCIK